MVEKLVKLAESTGDVEIYPVKHHITYTITVHKDSPHLKPGATVRAWLPYPQEYRQQRDIKLLSSSPPGVKFDWQHLPEAVKALEAGEDIDYQGASGPIDIEPLEVTEPANPSAGFYDAYRYKNARLGIYGSVAVPRSKKGVQRFPIKYVSPRVPGVGPQPKVGATGPTGATGATGANGANDGKATVSTGTREKAESDVARLHAAGLWATMQQD